jgi:hypothetical protein
MDQHDVSLSRTAPLVALLAACTLVVPSAASAAPGYDVRGLTTVNSTSGNTVANWNAFLGRGECLGLCGPKGPGPDGGDHEHRGIRRAQRHRATLAAGRLPRS